MLVKYPIFSIRAVVSESASTEAMSHPNRVTRLGISPNVGTRLPPVHLHPSLITSPPPQALTPMDTDSHTFLVHPQTPNSQIRHKSSLEHIFSFTLVSPPPGPHEIARATLLYHTILDDCDADNAVLPKPPGDSDREALVDRSSEIAELCAQEDLMFGDHENDDNLEDQYVPNYGNVPLHKLFRSIYDYCPTDDGRVNIVRIVLHGLFPAEDKEDATERSLLRIVPRAERWLSFGPVEKEVVYLTLSKFASDFLEGFFVPLKAQGRCTPSVSTLLTPTSRSEVGPDQGTPKRLGGLRTLCMARDGNRCVITRKYDIGYLTDLVKRTPGLRIRQTGIKTEAAHIIPHSLNSLADPAGPLHPSKCTVWRILNMFDPGISSTLTGTMIDMPANAMMLVSDLHDRFGRLECYLEPAPSHGPHTYTFHTVRGALPLDPYFAPASPHVVFSNHERVGAVMSDLPSPRLLAIHRACCMMLSMSGASEYVESLVRDTQNLMQRGVLAEDGGSNITLLLRLRGLHDDTVEAVPEWAMEEPVVLRVW